MDEETKAIMEDIITFCNVLEGAASQLRKSAEAHVGTVSEHKPEPEKPLLFDTTKIKWTQIEALTNPKGPFEASDDVNSLDFKALHKHILETKKEKGTPTVFIKERAGAGTYWIFQNGATIGRRLVKKKYQEAHVLAQPAEA